LKHCNGCDEDKPLTEFYFHKTGRRAGKPCSRCKECDRSIPLFINKSCPTYLGCDISEIVLSHEFPGFKRMPTCNPDYDYDCPKGFKIDVKSACRYHSKKDPHDMWKFRIRKNTVANYFLCIAFDDRQNLKPEHIWLIPGYVINHKIGFGITDSPKSLAKWSQFERPLDNVLNCCNKMR